MGLWVKFVDFKEYKAVRGKKVNPNRLISAGAISALGSIFNDFFGSEKFVLACN
jgi:hypothetical protein